VRAARGSSRGAQNGVTAPVYSREPNERRSSGLRASPDGARHTGGLRPWRASRCRCLRLRHSAELQGPLDSPGFRCCELLIGWGIFLIGAHAGRLILLFFRGFGRGMGRDEQWESESSVVAGLGQPGARGACIMPGSAERSHRPRLQQNGSPPTSNHAPPWRNEVAGAVRDALPALHGGLRRERRQKSADGSIVLGSWTPGADMPGRLRDGRRENDFALHTPIVILPCMGLLLMQTAHFILIADTHHPPLGEINLEHLPPGVRSDQGSVLNGTNLR